MDMYGQKNKSIPQKITIIILEILLLGLSYWIMFLHGNQSEMHRLGAQVGFENNQRRIVIFIFSIIVFLRIGFMMLFLLERRIPWEESFSIPFAFALYYVGYALLVLPTHKDLDGVDLFGIFIFMAGSFINTFSELQRHSWKKQPENKGKIYSKGLFKFSMHINYFGDLLWVSGYAILTRNRYSILIPVFLFCFFTFYNIPKLDTYLSEKYKEQFDAYRAKTKKFIPFIY